MGLGIKKKLEIEGMKLTSNNSNLPFQSGAGSKLFRHFEKVMYSILFNESSSKILVASITLIIIKYKCTR